MLPEGALLNQPPASVLFRFPGDDAMLPEGTLLHQPPAPVPFRFPGDDAMLLRDAPLMTEKSLPPPAGQNASRTAKNMPGNRSCSAVKPDGACRKPFFFPA
jgi:hypothetical protein